MLRLLFLLVLIPASLTRSQVQEEPPLAQVPVAERAALDEVLDAVQKAIQHSDAGELQDRLSEDFRTMGYGPPMARNNVLPQLLQQLPKLPLELVTFTRSAEGKFVAGAVVRSIGLEYELELDADFKLLRLDVVQPDVEPEAAGAESSALERITLPFHLVDGFILVDGSVNGTRGKFMLDTGSGARVFLNNHRIKLDRDQASGSGFAGSGQRHENFSSVVDSIRIGDRIRWEKQTVLHSDFAYVESGITSDFLGFLGYGFLKDYEFELDYDRQVVELFALQGDSGETKIERVARDEVVAVLELTFPLEPSLPFAEFKLAGETISAAFDTGNQTSIHVEGEARDRLLKSGAIAVCGNGAWYGQSTPRRRTYETRTLAAGDTALAPVRNIGLFPHPPGTPKGAPEIVLGYQFLKSYVTVWNFEKKTLKLVSR